METEELLFVFSVLMLFFDLILLSRMRQGEKSRPEYGFYAATLACALIATSYLMLVLAFLNDDFSLVEVYSHSSLGLSVASKVYATWGGASSSMLFLTFLIGVSYFVYRFRTYYKGRAADIAAYKIFDLLLIFFVFLILLKSPFQRLSTSPREGAGLSPLLQTFWMFAHPPVVFAGYVFVIFAFVLTLGNMSVQESSNSNSRLLKQLLQTAWLTTTLGIAIGGLWAYEVLGWGGYWGWDPVETASLLPWLALTAYFHLGQVSSAAKSLAKEFMLLVTFAGVIFATALTRGGLLESVHAFGTSAIGPLLLVLALTMIAYFFYLKGKIKKPVFSWRVDKGSLYSVSFFIGFWSLIFILLVCFVGVAFPIVAGALLSSSLKTEPAFYYNWIFPFAMAFVVGLIGCSMHGITGFKRFALLVAIALGAGVVLVQAQWPTPVFLANMGIPLLAVGLFAALYRMVSVLPKNKRSLRQFGRSLLHLAIIITLVGVFFSSAAKQENMIVDARPNTRIETLGLAIDLKNFTVYTGTGRVYSMQWGLSVPESSALKMDVTIEQGGRFYASVLWIHYYTLHGIVSTPLIITTLTGDIYLRLLQTESMTNSLLNALDGKQVIPEDLILSVEVNPAVYLVWAGVALMSLGIAVPLLREILKPFPRKDSKPKNRVTIL